LRRIASDALLLRSVAYGESDLVVTFLTETDGKVSAMARGGRKSSKRMGGALEPFHTVHVDLDDRGRELATLKEARIVRVRSGIVTDIDAVEAAGTALRWVRHLVPARTPEREAFTTVVAMLDALDAGQSAPRAVLAVGGLHLLTDVGYALAFEQCVRCGKACPPDRAATIDAARGGIVCQTCGGARSRISADLRRIAAAAQRGEDPPIGEAEAAELLALVESAMAAHSDVG